MFSFPLQNDSLNVTDIIDSTGIQDEQILLLLMITGGLLAISLLLLLLILIRNSRKRKRLAKALLVKPIETTVPKEDPVNIETQHSIYQPKKEVLEKTIATDTKPEQHIAPPVTIEKKEEIPLTDITEPTPKEEVKEEILPKPEKTSQEVKPAKKENESFSEEKRRTEVLKAIEQTQSREDNLKIWQERLKEIQNQVKKQETVIIPEAKQEITPAALVEETTQTTEHTEPPAEEEVIPFSEEEEVVITMEEEVEESATLVEEEEVIPSGEKEALVSYIEAFSEVPETEETFEEDHTHIPAGEMANELEEVLPEALQTEEEIVEEIEIEETEEISTETSEISTKSPAEEKIDFGNQAKTFTEWLSELGKTKK